MSGTRREDEFGEFYGESPSLQGLALADQDARLPWLEAEDDPDQGGFDTGRMIGFALGALVILAAVAGGAYFLLGNRSNPELIADGSTIEAPVGPYKERPDDPGGATAAGTGDTSFQVAEGRGPASRVATQSTMPEPGADASQDGNGAEAPTASAGSVGVQVGAYGSKDGAEQGWQTLVGRHAEQLSGVSHRVLQGTADGATIFRLQAVAGSLDAARQLCANLKASGADCQVKN